MLKHYFLGLFEISLFMKDGIDRFGDQISDFKKSFIVLALTLPITLFSVSYLYAAKDELQSLSLNAVIVLFALKFFICTGLLVAFAYFICKILKKKDKFIKYVVVSNWVTLSLLILYLPFFLLMITGVQSYNEIYPYLVIKLLYGYALGAFITKRILEIPWELAVFLIICTMAINEFCYETMFLIASIN